MRKSSGLDENQSLKMDNVADRIAWSVDELVDFQNVVETVYEKIAFNLPKIDSAIKQNDREAKSMLGMISNEQSHNDLKQKVDGMVIKANQSIDFFFKQIKAMNQREKDLMGLLKGQLKEVDGMKELLGNIEIVLSDIEMTTSHALETANKSGKAGKSFRYLAREVIKISSQSKQIVQNLIKIWIQLDSKVKYFFQTEQEIVSTSPKEIDAFCVGLRNAFQGAIEHLQGLTMSLSDIVIRNENVDTAIMNLMEAMQNQDIIKQCMDNIIISMNEIIYYAKKRASESVVFSELPQGEKAQMLDEFSFQEEVPLLCEELLSNVEEQLVESNASLDENFNTLKDIVSEDTLPQAKQENSEGASQAGLDKILAEAGTGIESWFEEFSASAGEKEELLSICNDISILFGKMQKQLLLLRNVTFRFRLIVILSKTELMKTTVLSDHKIAQKLNGLTMKIDRFIKQCEGQVRKVEGGIRQFMVSFGNNLNESSIKSSVFADEMNSCLENFSDYKGEVFRTLSNITECGDRLNNLFTDFFKGVEQIGKVIEKNLKIKTTFHDVSEQIHAIRQDFQGNEFMDWHISDDRLLSIINKFTVFGHKQIADEMFGLGIEDGDEGGDLTLF